MNKSVWLKLLLMLVLIGAVGVSAYYVAHTNIGSYLPSSISSTVTSTPTPNPYPGWKIYANAQYGISFKYPPTFSSANSSSLSIQPMYFGVPLATIQNLNSQYSLPNYKQFSIFAVDISPDVALCSINEDKSAINSLAKVNGVNFLHANLVNGAAGTQTSTDVYRIVKGQYCVEILTILGVSTDGIGIDMTKEAASKAIANQDFSNILSTFSLVN